MARYIDADKQMEEVDQIGGHNLCEWDTLGVRALIDRQPTADVVPQREYDILKSLITHKEEDAYNKGYEDGKADMQVEVAIKIFDEIEYILYKLLPPKVFHLYNGDTVGNSFDLGKDRALHEALNEIAEHRKKYTEVKNENT